MSDDPRIDECYATLTQRWSAFPQADALRQVLGEAFATADAAQPELLTLAGAATRPGLLRLAELARADADDMYHREWVQFCCAAEGGAWVVYRRREGDDYAAPWSTATTLPEGLLRALPAAVMLAVAGGDG